MVNFTVRDLDAMLAQLRAAGVEVDERVEDHEYGRFGWGVDPEGNRFELWEPLPESSASAQRGPSPSSRAPGARRRGSGAPAV